MRVVEGSAFVAMPLAGLTLTQLGADLIRFDPIGGGLDHSRWPITREGKSLFWAGLNKGKRSIAVDIRAPRGQEILRALICAPGDDAGLFITNFPARGWLDYENLKQQRDDLIMVNLVGRRDGSSQVDYTVNPAVGFPAVTGPKRDPRPVNHLLPAWDAITGNLSVVALLAAERQRRATGAGQFVKIALHHVALAMLGNLGKIAEVVINDADRPRDGNYLYGAFGRDFETGDGKRVMVVGLTPAQWKGLVKATGLADEIDALATRARRDRRDLRRQSGVLVAIPDVPRGGRQRSRLLDRQSDVRERRSARHRHLPDARLARGFQCERTHSAQVRPRHRRPHRRDPARPGRPERGRAGQAPRRGHRRRPALAPVTTQASQLQILPRVPTRRGRPPANGSPLLRSS
jgi:hypothetical protein